MGVKQGLFITAVLVVLATPPVINERIKPLDVSNIDADLLMRNTLTACERNYNLKRYGKTQLAVGLIPWCLLRLLSVITPLSSWLKLRVDGELGTGDIWPLQTAESPQIKVEHLKFMVWGLTSAAFGVLWLIALLILLPLVWCACCRKLMCRDVHNRARTRFIVNKVVFWICWVFALVLCCGQIWYSVWSKFDYNAAICLPQRKVEEAFLYGISESEATFPALVPSQNIPMRQLIAATNSLSAGTYDASSMARARLKEIWAMFATFTAYGDLTGQPISFYTASSNISLTTVYDPSIETDNIWGIRMIPDIPDELGFDLSAGKPYLNSITSSNTGTISAQLPTSIANVESAYDASLTDVRTAFVKLQNIMSNLGNRLLYEKDKWMSWLYPVYVTACALPVLGLIAAFIIFEFYSRSKNFPLEAASPQRRLAGFMVFGYAFWGIVLFLGGGYMLMAMYFPADMCHVADDVLNHQIPDDVYTDLFFGVPASSNLFNRCLGPELDNQIPLPILDEADTQDIEDNINNGKAAYTYLKVDGSAEALDGLQLSSFDVRFTKPAALSTTSDKLWDSNREELITLINSLTACQISLSCPADDFGCASLGSKDIAQIPTAVDLNAGLSGGNPVQIAALYDDQSVTATTCDDVSLSTPGVMCECSPTSGSTGWLDYWTAAHLLVLWDAVDTSNWIIGNGDDLTGLFRVLKDQSNPISGTRDATYSQWKSLAPAHAEAIREAARQLLANPAQSFYDLSAVAILESAYNAIVDPKCNAIYRSVKKIRESSCDSLSGDLTSVATIAVLLGVLHLIAFVVLLIWWLPRRRFQDIQDEAIPIVKPKRGMTEEEFMAACRDGDIPKAEEGAEQYAANTVHDIYNNTPLHMAAYYGHPVICENLIKKGWNPNAFNAKRHTPFTACVANLYLDQRAKKEVLILLKDYGAWVDVYTGEGDTPLMIAARADEQDVVALLLDWNANPLHRDLDYHLSSMGLAKSAHNDQIYEMLRAVSPKYTELPRGGFPQSYPGTIAPGSVASTTPTSVTPTSGTSSS